MFKTYFMSICKPSNKRNQDLYVKIYYHVFENETKIKL